MIFTINWKTANYLELLGELDFHGLIMIEVRFQEGMQKYFMIEANPRLMGANADSSWITE